MAVFDSVPGEALFAEAGVFVVRCWVVQFTDSMLVTRLTNVQKTARIQHIRKPGFKMTQKHNFKKVSKPFSLYCSVQYNPIHFYYQKILFIKYNKKTLDFLLLAFSTVELSSWFIKECDSLLKQRWTIDKLYEYNRSRHLHAVWTESLTCQK